MLIQRFAPVFFILISSLAFGHEGWPPPEGLEGENLPISEVEMEDQALKDCLVDWANGEFQKYKTVKEVREISCADRGIRSLKGIEIFVEYMIALDLSGNEIEDWSPLYNFHHVGALYLFDTEMTCSQLVKLRKRLVRAMIVGTDLKTCTEEE